MAKAIPIEQYIREIEGKIRSLDDLRKDIGKEVATVHAKQTQRIFGKGFNAQYSTKPTLAGSNVFGNRNKFGGTSYTFATQAGSRKFFGNTKGKEWRKVITTKGARNLLLIPGGYKAIRAADGRQTQRVNLNHTGILFKDFASSLTNRGFIWSTGITRKENVGKFEGNLKKYGRKVWEIPQKDLDTMNKNLGLSFIKFMAV